MTDFQSKYPAFYALMLVFGICVQDVEIPGSALQKLEGSINLIQPILGFISGGQISLLGPEMDALKATPADIEAGIEVLVTEMAFSSDKAKTIIPAAFGVGEWLVTGISPIQGLVAAIKS